MTTSNRKIAFLINPISGSASARKSGTTMINTLKQEGKYNIFEPQNSAEMLAITKDLAQKNYEAVFACGGDGTLNLISSQLLGTETAMGIVPLGSGNGYARHQNIPLNWQHAIKAAQNPIETVRDTAMLNGFHFLNIAGLGFAAKISHEFKQEAHRGFKGYVKTVLKNMKMEPFKASIQNENGLWQGDVWMVDFCNGSQWGNNFRIDPGARDDDGSLSAIIFKKISPIKIPVLGFQLATGKANRSPDVYRINGSKFVIGFEGKKPLHLDGEAFGFIEGQAVIEVVPKSLKIWTPG